MRRPLFGALLLLPLSIAPPAAAQPPSAAAESPLSYVEESSLPLGGRAMTRVAFGYLSGAAAPNRK